MANAIFHSPQQSNPTFTAEVKTTRHEKLSGRDLPEQHPISAITGLESALNGKQAVIEDLDEIRYGAEKGATALQPGDVPIPNDGILTIQKNGTSAGTFSANSAENKTINITVPTQASDVGALSSSTKYGASLSLSINSSTYVVTAQLKDQNGNNLGSAQTIDLPLESVVVNGAYDSEEKEIILTLQNGNTIDIPVGDLVDGLVSDVTVNGVSIVHNGVAVITNMATTDTAQDITETKTFKAQQKLQSGAADGALVLGADVGETTLTNNTRKLGRMTLPPKLTANPNVAIISADTQAFNAFNVLPTGYTRTETNTVSFGSLPGDTTSTAPDLMGFTLAKTQNATATADKIIALEMSKEQARFNVPPNYNGDKLITANEVDNKLNIYGTSTTAAATVQKEVSIPSITSLNAGQLIIVTPTATSTVANSTLKLNNFDAYPMLYGGSAITTSTDSYVWIKDVPGWWLFDGSNWLFAGHGTDINTTYSAMTVANIIAGTETSGRLMRSDYLKNGICGVVTAYSSGDTITPADKYLYNSTAIISALTVNAPTSPDVRYVSQINFSSGTTATTLSYPSAFKVYDGCDDVQVIGGFKTFVPASNKRYQLFIMYDGVNTILFAKGV